MNVLERASADLIWLFSVDFVGSPTGTLLERAKSLSFSGPGPRPCEVTAWPSARKKGGVAWEPDEYRLVRYGELSRRYARLRETAPEASQALAWAFGDVGMAWAAHRRGRSVALFPLVEAGRELLRRGRRSSRLTDHQLVAVEVCLADVASKGDPARRVLVATATTQATALLGASLARWAGVS